MAQLCSPHTSLVAAGDVDDNNEASEAIKDMFGLSLKAQEKMTPPKVHYDSDEEDGGSDPPSPGPQSPTEPPSSPQSRGDVDSAR